MAHTIAVKITLDDILQTTSNECGFVVSKLDAHVRTFFYRLAQNLIEIYMCHT